MKKIYVVLILILFCDVRSISAQNEEIITDRPDQTESAFVVPKGSFQWETGFVYEKVSSNLKNYAWNTSLLRYGLLQRLELRLGFNYLGNMTTWNGHTFKTNGMGPLILGFKTAIADEEGAVPQLALLGSLVVPNTGTSEFENDYLGGEFRFNLEYTLSENISFGANLGAIWSGMKGEGYATGIYTAVIGMGVTERLSAFAEIYGFLPGEGRSDHRWDGGLTYKVSDNFQLDGSGGIGLSSVSPDYFLSFGFSVRIP